ncbi:MULTISPECIES: hypothetical protein [Ferruginibacter]|uniref:hypothetical protein n=1 Tax=Ferruginibacter sp. SUN106 TaxID=2978348 RepID=UPI003D368333
MKSDVMGIGAPINKKDLKELLKETKETIAVDVRIDGNNNRSFGVVDLWNVQKRQRTTASMMRRWSN